MRDSKVVPREVANSLVSGLLPQMSDNLSSSVGRILYFFKTAKPDPEALKAFAQLEMTRLERGMFWLDVVVSAAPLLGLLGTVAGLVTVFSVESDSLPTPVLRQDIMDIKDLAPGMELTGTVRNVVDFGAFVDIGVHQDGLVHISEITDRYIKHPSDVLEVGQAVTVWVKDVDVKKNRIGLTMKNPALKKKTAAKAQ